MPVPEAAKRTETFRSLPPRFLPVDYDPSPRLLHYGFGLRDDSAELTWKKALSSYLKDHGLKQESPFSWPIALHDCVFHMSEVLGHPLDLVTTTTDSQEFMVVISLYSNYDVHYSRLDKKKEKIALDFLRRQLGDPDLKPMWFFDNLSERECRDRWWRPGLPEGCKERSLLYGDGTGPDHDASEQTAKPQKRRANKANPRTRSDDDQQEESAAAAPARKRRTRSDDTQREEKTTTTRLARKRSKRV